MDHGTDELIREMKIVSDCTAVDSIEENEEVLILLLNR